MIWAMILVAFAAWGVAVGNVSLHEQDSGLAGAAPLRDGTCGIFVGPLFDIVQDPQAVITHEVGHCIGYDHPDEWKLTIMIPNIPAPTEEDLAAPLTHDPWFEPFQFRYVVGVASDHN